MLLLAFLWHTQVQFCNAFKSTSNLSADPYTPSGAGVLQEVTCDETDFGAALEQKMSFVRAFWDTLSEAERRDSLTLDVLRIDRWTIAVAADAHDAGSKLC